MRAAKNYIAMVDRLYRRACDEEGIDPKADITDFSDTNVYGRKFKAVYNEEKYQKARRLAKR